MLPSELPEIEGECALDTETSGLFEDDGARVATVSIAFEVPDDWEHDWKAEEIAPGYWVRIASMAWPFAQGVEGKPESRNQGVLFPDAENLPKAEWDALVRWSSRRRLVMHNAKFDLHKMRVGVGGGNMHPLAGWPGTDLQDQVVWDTQNGNDLLWPLERTSLKPTCARLFGATMEDEAKKVKDYLYRQKLPAGRWDLMPWSIIGQYADQDARMTLMLRLRQQWEIESGEVGWMADATAALSRRLAAMRVCYNMERRGLPYDEVGSRDAATVVTQRAVPIAASLPFAPTVEAAKKYFFGEGRTAKGVECCNLVPYAVTDKGAASMTAEVVGRMVADEVPYAEKWAQYRKITTAASMWYEGYADAMGTDGRLRTCFRQNGTVSGRFSAERVNLQAIPHDYRLSGFEALSGIPTPRQLIARGVPSGWKIYELDLAQAELRVAAMFAKQESMLEMVRNGEDLHAVTTIELGLAVPGDPSWARMRNVGKRGNFSLLFGAQGKTFREMVSKETGVQLGEAEADRIVRDWNRLYPAFNEAINTHQRAVEQRQRRGGVGWVATVNKERRWYGRFDDARSAFNQRVQGNLAQFGLSWMLKTEERLRGEDDLQEGGGGLVLTVHDSLMLLLPEGLRGEGLAVECAQIGRDLWKEWFPGVPGEVDSKCW